MAHADPGANPPSSRIFDIPTLLFLLAASIFLYSFLFIPPFLPIQIVGDSVFSLASSQRMYEGETIYRDFFEFVTPGTAFVNFLMFNLFGLRLWIPNVLSMLLGLGLAWLGVLIARKMMRPSLALLPSAIFLVGVREFLCDPTHHWFSLLSASAAIAVLIEQRTPARIVAVGFFCGLTASFMQSRGLAALVGFGVFLWWESRQKRQSWRGLLKQEAWLMAGFLATLIGVNAYFVWKAGLARFLWSTVVFGIKYYPKDADSNTFRVFIKCLPTVVPLRNLLRWNLEEWLFLYAAVPLILILFFARYWRGSGKKPVEFWTRPMLVAIVGSFMLLGVTPAPAPHRMAVAELPALILLGWLLDSPGKFARALAGIITVCVLLTALYGVTRRRPTQAWILETPRGELALTDPNAYRRCIWLQQHTRPSDYLYEPGDAPTLYFSLDLRNPTPVPFLTENGYTTTEQVAEVIRGLQQHYVRYIVWTPTSPDMIPGRDDPSDDHLEPLRDYIRSHYQVVKVFQPSDLIWERRD